MFEPLVGTVTTVDVMVYVALANPVTLKAAAFIVPGVAVGNVTPPVFERAPAVLTVTAPVEDPATILPKERSAVFVIAMGEIIVAVAAAVAVCWALAFCANRIPNVISSEAIMSFFIAISSE